MNSKKTVIATVILFLVIVLTFVACNKGDGEVIVVTDVNGVPVTDTNGEPITVIAQTQVVTLTDANGEAVTDENGEVMTTIEYVSQTAAVPVTDENGNAVTTPEGEVQTTFVDVPMPGESTTTGSTGKPVTPVKPSLPDGVSYVNALGGTGDDNLVDVAATPDGGYVVIGSSTSKDGDFSAAASYASKFGTISKYTADGTHCWTKTVGGKASTSINGVVVDKNGNIYIGGSTKENSVVTVNGSEYDGFIQKYTSDGNLVFSKGWGGSTNDLFSDIAIDSKGNIYTVGLTYSTDGDATGLGVEESVSKAIIVKFNNNGSLISQKGYSSNSDQFTNISINGKDEIYVGGTVSSKDEYGLFKSMGSADIMVLKFRSDLSYYWVKSFGGSKIDGIQDIYATDNGCIAVGLTTSKDGNLESVGNKGEQDALIIKYNSDGSVGWYDTFAGDKAERFTDVTVGSDGSIYAVGYSCSATRDFTVISNQGAEDGFVVKYNSDGSVASVKGFGGTKSDVLNGVCILNDGSLVATGYSLSSDKAYSMLSKKSDGSKKMGVIFKFGA